MPLALHLPGSSQKAVAALPALHPGPPTGLAWEEETQELPLAEACRVGRSHQFAVLAPSLPEGPHMGGEGATDHCADQRPGLGFSPAPQPLGFTAI